MELIAGPDADTADDPTTNPRAEHTAIQRIVDFQVEVEILRAVVFEREQKAKALRKLADLLPPGGEVDRGLGQAMLDALSRREESRS